MEPASIRYKNPGAMWGSALAIKWGAEHKPVTLNDGKGQGNNIAVFPTYVAGICAQLDLWRTSKNYRNKRFADAIAVWSGHNEVASYIAFCKKRVPGLTENTVMDDAFWHSSAGVAFLKAQAWHEAGREYPAPVEDWLDAQQKVFAADPPLPGWSLPMTPLHPVLHRGSHGNEVKKLQKILQIHADGYFGSLTVRAVRNYQYNRNLVNDGVVGPATWALLLKNT